MRTFETFKAFHHKVRHGFVMEGCDHAARELDALCGNYNERAAL